MIAAGATVRVRDAWPELDGPAHVRTPHYLRGRVGTVLRHLGDFPNPEDIAFNRPAPLLPLFHVGFRLADVWDAEVRDADVRDAEAGDAEAGDAEAGGAAAGQGRDTLLVEIYGPWLEELR